MSEAKTLTIGTRGSKLALIQTRLVADALRRLNDERGLGLTIAIKIITTKGDTNQAAIPLDTVGKAWFTAEIEQALQAGEIDLAVHSLKDMPPEMATGLATFPVLGRADPRDVLISKPHAVGERSPLLKDLPRGAVVGTDSTRRKILILDERPDLIVKSIRGNVDTRLKKLRDESADAEHYDAIVIAAAGLERLNMLDVVTEFFDPTVFSIAPGQGILAAQTREGETDLIALLRAIEHAPTRIAADAELAFTRAIGGGCKLPVGCYARIEGDVATGGTIAMYGMMDGGDGKKIIRKSKQGPVEQATVLAEALAREFV